MKNHMKHFIGLTITLAIALVILIILGVALSNHREGHKKIVNTEQS
jgi:uncharacterized alpha/beta hydrolase family protein